MRKKKNSLILGMILLVLVLGIGYAYLNTTLNISGTTDVDANTWNVYWDNVQVTNESVAAETPEIDTNLTTVSFSVHLSKPGDFYEFTVDAKNDGTIDAMIDSITKTINNSTTIPNYLNYIVTYSDGFEIKNNQLLAANKKETYKVRIEYRTDINPIDLPSSAQSLNINFGVTYIQSDSSVAIVNIYDISEASGRIGGNVQPYDPTYDNYQDAVTAFNHPMFLRYVVSNNIINEIYVGFVLNDNVYYLRGGINETDLDEKPVYESNKAVLLNAFGSSNCTLYTSPYETTYYECRDSNLGVRANARINGEVRAAHNYYKCYVRDGVRAYCECIY